MDIKKILHHLLFGIIAYFSFGFTEASVVFPNVNSPIAAYFHLPPIAGFLLGMTVFLLVTAKIITYNHRKTLKGTNSVLWAKAYSVPAVCAFAVLLACCALFYLAQDTNFHSTSNLDVSAPAEEIAELRINAATNFFVLFLGSFFLWMLFLKNMISDRGRDWRGTIISFVKTDVSVYLIFRAAVFLLSLGGTLLIVPQSSGIQNHYFLFALDDEQVQSIATGSLSGSGSFLSGITEAASFYVLITMAEELLSSKSKHTPAERFRRMFLETDTVKLMFMTLICIVTGFLSSGGKATLLTTFVNTVLFVLWLISSLLFLADTAVLPYVIIFSSLGFIERILPLPEVSGFLALVYPLIIIARILLFSVVSVMIANYQINRKKDVSLGIPVTKSGRPTFSHIIWNATFLDVILLLLRIGEYGLKAFRKKAPASSDERDIIQIVALAKMGNDYIEKWIGKITQATGKK